MAHPRRRHNTGGTLIADGWPIVQELLVAQHLIGMSFANCFNNAVATGFESDFSRLRAPLSVVIIAWHRWYGLGLTCGPLAFGRGARTAG